MRAHPRVFTLLLATAIAAPLVALTPASAAADAAPAPLDLVAVAEVTSLRYAGRIAQAAYSPDGAYLAVAVAGGPVFILNSTTFGEVRNISTPAAWVQVSSLSWGPASDKVAVGYQGGAVAVYRIPFGPSPWFVQGLNFDVRGVAWSPDGRFLAAGIVHSIFVYWGADGTLNSTLNLDYGGSQPAGLSWSRDSEYIAIGQQAYSPTGAIVAIFEAKSWTKALGWRWLGPAMDSVAFEGRSQFLAAHLGGSRVEIWEVRNWTLFANLSSTSGLEQFAWTADGSRLVTLDTEPAAAPNQSIHYGAFELVRLGGGAGNSSAMGVSPDGRRVAVGYFDGTLRVLSLGGDRLFDDATPLVATTGDPLTFSVRSTAAGQVDVSYRDTLGGAPTSAALTPSGDRHTLTITVPTGWVGPLLYEFTQGAIVSPERRVRVLDNDAPTLLAWNFTRTGAQGETGSATATVGDNVRLTTASFQMAVDGVMSALASAGDNQTVSFSLVVPLSPQNRTVRLELNAQDTSGNGGLVFETIISLEDRISPVIGADLSLSGTAGGRIQLGTVATDERGPPTTSVTWRELTVDAEGPWQTFTYGVPAPGSVSYLSTFPLGRSTVAVEYSFDAWDGAGNHNWTAIRIQPVVDREPPEIVADLSDREAVAGGVFHLGLVVRDNVGNTSVIAFVQEAGGGVVQLDMDPWPLYGAGAVEENQSVGTTALALDYWFVVTDTEGNSISSGKRTAPIRDRDPPDVAVVEPVLRATAGAAYAFHVEVTDRSDVGNLTVYFRRAGESAFLQEEMRPDSKTAVGTVVARYTVSLEALGITTFRDGRDVEFHFFVLDSSRNAGTLGSPADPVKVRILDGASPVARFLTAGSLVRGSLLSFDASSSTDDLGIVEYNWTIDGQPVGNATVLSWTFADTGDHTVTLSVRDGAGRDASQTQTLTVEAPPTVTSQAGGSSLLIAGVAVAIGAAAVGALYWMRGRRKPED